MTEVMLLTEQCLHFRLHLSVTKYIDESGSVVAEYTYDAFGKTIAQSGLMADIFRHRFSTKYYDAETGKI